MQYIDLDMRCDRVGDVVVAAHRNRGRTGECIERCSRSAVAKAHGSLVRHGFAEEVVEGSPLRRISHLGETVA